MKNGKQLTPREIEVMALAKQGKSYKGIAQELGIERPTVKFHIINIRRKIKVKRVLVVI